jgi:hypothetical protein
LLISPFTRQNGLDIEQRQPMRLTERVATGDVGQDHMIRHAAFAYNVIPFSSYV